MQALQRTACALSMIWRQPTEPTRLPQRLSRDGARGASTTCGCDHYEREQHVRLGSRRCVWWLYSLGEIPSPPPKLHYGVGGRLFRCRRLGDVWAYERPRIQVQPHDTYYGVTR